MSIGLDITFSFRKNFQQLSPSLGGGNGNE